MQILQIFLQRLPDKTSILLFMLWIWTYLLFKAIMFANFMLKMVIKFLPDTAIPVIKQKTPVKIIMALDNSGNNVTNKLVLFMNFKWNKNMFDTNGGVDLDMFFTYTESSVIWITYMLDSDIGCGNSQFLSLVSQDITNTHDTTAVQQSQSLEFVGNCVKIIAINAKSKRIYKMLKTPNKTQCDDILFGEINFY